MADKLETLRAAGRASMQALVDRALVQDEVSRFKRIRMERGGYFLGIFICAPMAYLFCKKIMEMTALHEYGTNGLTQIFVQGAKNYRQMYAPQVWAKEKKVRPYETVQFGKIH
ncbi:unnamed protein product [Blepharisma stoltei]|uniref:Uncharacterized protein n=1 Tax=Blepharisma stoltei TaxID=1481888 RepID=A0AAU9J7F9_9CILI|nr:unnamed protein product [Blepharisma stoltei]